MSATEPTFARCTAVMSCMVNPASYENDAGRSVSGFYLKPDPDRVAKYALRQLELARERDVAQHQVNLQIMERNREFRERIEALMVEAGVPKTYRERDLKSRSAFAKFKTLDAGYLGDLKRCLPIDDGFTEATATYDRLLAAYQKFADAAVFAAEEAKQAASREAERQKAERRANVELVKIILRYELDEDSTWSQVLDALRKRDQRLDLAVAMSLTRGNWSEGFYRVRDAVDRFSIRDDGDKDILNDVLGCMDSDDGRVFRDTTWSYSRLFAEAADQQLSADIQLALGKAGDQ